MSEHRYLSPVLAAELARWPEPPAYLDSAGGLTPTPCREYSPAQQAILRGQVPTGLKVGRAKIGGVRG